MNTKLPKQIERMKHLKSARYEAATITAQLRVRKAMLAKVPKNVDLILNCGDMVRVFRKTDKKYLGTYPVDRVQGSQVFVIVNDNEVQHNPDQVVPSKEYEYLVNGLGHSINQFQSTKIKKKHSPPGIFITEVLHPRDHRHRSQEAMASNLESCSEGRSSERFGCHQWKIRHGD